MADVSKRQSSLDADAESQLDHQDGDALPSLNDILSFSDIDVERDFGSLLSMIKSEPDVPALQRTTSETPSSDSDPEPATPETQPSSAVDVVPVEPPLTTITITDVTPKLATSHPAMNPLASLPGEAAGTFNTGLLPMPQHVDFTMPTPTPYAPAFTGSYFPYHNFLASMPMQPMNHMFSPFVDPRFAPNLMHENALMQAQLEMQSYALSHMMAVFGSQQQPSKARKQDIGRVPRARTTSKRRTPYARKTSSTRESSASEQESDVEQLVTGWRQPSVLMPAPSTVPLQK